MPRFIADCHLGKLAKYLRFLGHDTLYFSHIDDDDLLKLARAENRIILSRDKLLSQLKNAPVFYLKPTNIAEQLQLLAKEFNLFIQDDSHRYCLICNTLLHTIDKSELDDTVPERVKAHFDFFQKCPNCQRIYWHGDHYKNMKAFLERIGIKEQQ